ILFFWVARMVMTGLHFTGESPFARVHLTGLVRDAEGQKMSKTKGNVLDPEDLVEEYGADAVRFTLALLDSPGRDIPLDAERMSGYRAFGNKIWNATRFALSRTAGAELLAELPTDGLALPERWILGRVSEAAERVSAHFEEFRFDLACDELYHFFWSDFCDWYLEMAKPGLDAATARPAVGEVTLTVLDRALRLLHPVMPFLSEELWQRLPGHETIHPETICLAPYPAAEPGWRLADEDAEAIDLVRRVVTTVRNDRAELKVPAKASATLAIEIGDAGGAPAAELLASAEIAPLLASLCGVTSVRLEAAPPSAPNKHPIGGLVVTPLFASAGDRVDVERLRAQLEEVEGALARARARLDNPSFVEKAPEAVVDGARRAVDELSRKREHLIESLEVASR
ncbi:MAG: class I tRNA ligase family protein, partial [Acidobacteria bacterium]|nr:class I tRNA ligase family protein [Acidobacteriota bacterium]